MSSYHFPPGVLKLLLARSFIPIDALALTAGCH
jgi:hypothetical protein